MAREHRMLAFVYGGKNYTGPVEQVLGRPRNHDKERERRVLDVGTGSGLWYVLSCGPLATIV